MNESTPERTERFVGIFVVVALLLLLAGFAYYLYHTAERKGWRKPRCPYYTLVQSAEGLEVGDPVRMMGFDIGELTIIEPLPPTSYDHVFIGIEIKQPYYGYIWTDSKIKVVPSGFLGKRQLEVIKGETGGATVFEKGNRISEVLIDGKPATLADNPKGPLLPPEESPSVTERAEKLLSQVEAALPNILTLTNRLNDVLDNSNILMTNSTSLIANLNTATAQLQPVLSNAAVITANLRDPRGSFGEWALPADLHTNLNASIVSLNDSLLNLAAITSNLNTQVESNDKILSQISGLVVNTDILVQGLKKHWLLRGVFQKTTATNAPPKKTGP